MTTTRSDNMNFVNKIFELQGDNFVSIKPYETLYCYNEETSKWESSDFLLRKFILNKLVIYFPSLERDLYRRQDEIINLYTETVGLRTDIIFDDKWWLLKFDNCTYDLKKLEFRESIKEDYLTTSTGYNWISPSDKKLKVINDMIEKILPYENERNNVLIILSASLSGKKFDYPTNIIGDGNNGKCTLTKFLIESLGNYSFIGTKTLYPREDVDARFNNKRLVLINENDTGLDQVSIKSYITQIRKYTLITVSNNTLDEKIEGVITLQFKSHFTNNDDIVDNKTIFKKDNKFVDSEFINEHRCAFMQILMNKY